MMKMGLLKRLYNLFMQVIAVVIIVALSYWLFYSHFANELPFDEPLERLKVLDILKPSALKKGQEQMAQQKVVIVGIARNNALPLPTVIKYIEHTGDFFADYRVIIFENDSTDKSKSILKKWQDRNAKVKVISQDFGKSAKLTLERFTIARNVYIDELKQNPHYQGFDMLLIVDMDMWYGWDMRGLFDSFSQIDKWDVVCANGIDNPSGNMYDMFAFRNEEFKEGPENPNYWHKIVPAGKKIYPVGSALIPVRSCFGGLAFYKRNFIKSCRYTYNNDCEHVLFHDCLREKNHARIFMNPSQVIRYSHYKQSFSSFVEEILAISNNFQLRFNNAILRYLHSLEFWL